MTMNLKTAGAIYKRLPQVTMACMENEVFSEPGVPESIASGVERSRTPQTLRRQRG
jgi:hypothetical protein